MVILRKGTKLYAGPVDNMLSSHGFFELKTDQMPALQAYLEKHPSFGSINLKEEQLTAHLNEELDAATLNQLLFKEGIVLSQLVKRKESLEEQFLALTKNN